MEIVFARKRAIRSVDTVQSLQKSCHIDGYLRQIDTIEMPGKRFALKPAINGPAERITPSRFT